MTGLTKEIHSIEEAMLHLFNWCLETHGKSPTHFILGPEAFFSFKGELLCKLHREGRDITSVEEIGYLGIPIVVSRLEGVDIGLPHSRIQTRNAA